MNSRQSVLIRFGKKVRDKRIEKGYSQEKLAHRAGLHRTYIGMIERGERNPSLRNIERFAKAFDLNISELLMITALTK